MVDCGVYTDGVRRPGDWTPVVAVPKVREIETSGQSAFAWIGLAEPDDGQMHDVADAFGLHELGVEDAVHARQRPKLERYDESLFLVNAGASGVEMPGDPGRAHRHRRLARPHAGRRRP